MIIPGSSIHELTSLQNLVDEWYDAPGNGRDKKEFNTTEKMDLYAKTEEEVAVLQSLYEENKDNIESIANLSKAIQNAFVKRRALTIPLVKWISQNTSYAEGPGMGFAGAYRSFGRLIILFNKTLDICRPDLMDVIEVSDECQLQGTEYDYDHSQPAINNIAEGTLFYIKKMNNEIPNLVVDLEGMIFSKMDIKSLVALTKTNQSYKKLALSELVNRLNKRTLQLSDIGFQDEKDLINFFGEESGKILNLTLACTPITDKTDWNELAKRLVNLNYLLIEGNSPTILELTNKFKSVEVLELNDICDLNTFNHILKSCPSIKQLACTSSTNRRQDLKSLRNHINNFTSFKNCPFLKEIKLIGNFTDLTGLESCTSLEKISFVLCQMDNIDILKNLPSLIHLCIFQSNISKIGVNLPTLKYFYADNYHPFKDFSFLKGSPLLEILSLKKIGREPNILDHGLTITTLELVDFFNSIIPEIKKCTFLKTLILASNWEHEQPIDLNELNACSSLETLSIENCNVADFSVLSGHPSLKYLYIQNCSNFQSAQPLDGNRIQIFYGETKEIPHSHCLANTSL